MFSLPIPTPRLRPRSPSPHPLPAASPPWNPTQQAYALQFQTDTVNILNTLPTKAQANASAVFSAACYVHCLSDEALFWGIRVRNESMRDLLERWYFLGENGADPRRSGVGSTRARAPWFAASSLEADSHPSSPYSALTRFLISNSAAFHVFSCPQSGTWTTARRGLRPSFLASCPSPPARRCRFLCNGGPS